MQATSGLGAAAAYALSKEGFCVVLGIAILPFSSIPFIYLFLFWNFELIEVAWQKCC